MEKINQREITNEIENVLLERTYVFSPSIGKRRTVSGKTYYVRGVFRGGQNFEQTMKRFAKDNFYKNRR